MKNNRTILLALIMLSVFSLEALAQEKKASPAAKTEGKIDGVGIVINYHQPSAKGRTMIGGEKVPYGEVWRTGANNATTIELTDDVKIEGKALAKGTYSLFTIPGESEWTIIFNSVAEQWGAYKYDESKDVLRVKVKAGKTKSHVETFNISIDGNDIVLAWENSLVKFEVKK